MALPRMVDLAASTLTRVEDSIECREIQVSKKVLELVNLEEP